MFPRVALVVLVSVCCCKALPTTKPTTAAASAELPLATSVIHHNLAFTESATVKRKHCVFLHGAGLMVYKNNTVDYEAYWGHVRSLTPRCSSWTFNHADTMDYEWDDPYLMRQYCADALSPTRNGTGHVETTADGVPLIKDTIVFSHSMGNEILAGAFRDQICDLDKETSHWFTASPFPKGTKAADVLPKDCKDNSRLHTIGDIVHACDPKTQKPVPSCASFETNYAGFYGLDKVFNDRVSGSICGISPAGRFTIFSPGLEWVAKTVKFGEENDGLVNFSSCHVVGGPSKYQSDPRSPFYMGRMNHVDTTCRTGDSMKHADQQPCSWYTHRTEQATNTVLT